jgi:hypothetical protein
MPQKYQVLTVVIDPATRAEGLNAELSRVFFSPYGFRIPALLWPKVKRLPHPLKIHIFPRGADKPVAVLGKAYRELNRTEPIYGIAIQLDKRAERVLEPLWKKGTRETDKRRLPRIKAQSDEFSQLFANFHHPVYGVVPIDLTDYTLHGLGVQVPFQLQKEFEIGRKVRVSLSQDQFDIEFADSSDTLSDEFFTNDDQNQIIFNCTVVRIVEFCFPHSERKKAYLQIGLQINELRGRSEKRWKKWLHDVVIELKEDQDKESA